MFSPQNILSLHTVPIRCVAKISGPVFAFLLISIQPASGDIGTSFHLTPDCSQGLTWDGAEWNNVEVSVAAGYDPGLYSVRLFYYNSAHQPGYTSNINVVINADG